MQQKNNKKIKSFDGVMRRTLVKEVFVPKPTYSLKDIVFSTLKMGGVGALAFALFLSISLSGSTMAYFSDSEKSTGNRMQAGVISFNLSASFDEEGRTLSVASLTEEGEEKEEYIEAVGTEEFEVDVVSDDSSLPLSYSVKGAIDESNPPGCDLLEVDVSSLDYHYTGLLKDFVSPKTEEMGTWYFFIHLPVVNDNLASNALCKGSMVFSAELAGVTADLSRTYTDEKSYEFELYNWDSGYVHSKESSVEETSSSALLGEDTSINTEAEVPEVLETASSTDPEIVEEETVDVPQTESLLLPEEEMITETPTLTTETVVETPSEEITGVAPEISESTETPEITQ